MPCPLVWRRSIRPAPRWLDRPCKAAIPPLDFRTCQPDRFNCLQSRRFSGIKADRTAVLFGWFCDGPLSAGLLAEADVVVRPVLTPSGPSTPRFEGPLARKKRTWRG